MMVHAYKRTTLRAAAIACSILAPLACRAAEPPRLEPAALGAVARVHTYGELYLASQPGAADLEVARALGVRAVVNLRRADEPVDFDEPRLVEDLGLAYYNPGFQSPAELTDAVLESALAALRDAPRPALIHCSTANRIGPVWILYRVLDGGADVETAVAEARTIGLRTPEYEQIARGYLLRREE